jgi:hypothetical protein
VKVSWKLFFGLAVFYFIVATIYFSLGGEPVGFIGIMLSGGLAILISYYLWFTDKRIKLQPQDNPEGEISDGAGEIGFFSPHSWWPLPVAFSAIVAGFGLILGWWLFAIGAGALIVSVLGFVFEYDKPTVDHH